MAESIRFTGVNFDAIEEFVGGDCWSAEPNRVVVATRQRPLYFSYGDTIVRNSDGTFSVLATEEPHGR